MRFVRAVIVLLAVGVLGAAGPGSQITVKLIAINDFHGYLQPSEKYRYTPPGGTKSIPIPVGGVAYLATMIAQLKAQNPLNAVVGAGDMVGASPLSSGLFHDEPAIEALSTAGLEITSVGNHEFDGGRVELLRKQNGGCRPNGKIGIDTCLTGSFSGAKFQYLAANVVDETTGKPLFAPYAIKYFDTGNGTRIGIAFVGVVLRETPTMVNASGTRDLRFTDEAAAINAALPAIHAQGVHAVVALVHQGVFPLTEYNEIPCAGARGDLPAIIDKLDPSISLVISGHTHRAYICPHGEGTHNPHVYYTSAGRYGQVVSDIDVTLDVASGTIAGIDAHNRLVVNDVAPNPLPAAGPALSPVPAIAALVARYVAASAPLVNRVVGKITADISLVGHEPQLGESGEDAMSDVVAASRLAASQPAPLGAQLAFINGGGVRSMLPFASPVNGKAPGDVTYGEAYSVTPFGDVLYTETLTGAKILTLLEEQFTKSDLLLLGIAGPLTYTWDASKPAASRVVRASVKFNGKPIDPKALFRVTVDGFLVEGGDGYTVLRGGAHKLTGQYDIDALVAYLGAHEPLAPPKSTHVTRLN